LITRVAAEHPEAEGSLMVHRLDMDSSGVMVVALNRSAQRELARQFEHRVVKKVYQALVEGRLEAESGRISLAFRLDPENRPHQIFDPVNGKLGETNFKRLGFERREFGRLDMEGLNCERLDVAGLDIGGLDFERAGAKGLGVECLSTERSDDEAEADTQDAHWITRVRLEPITGRTHQLRLHASHAAGLGRPILGDRLYGNVKLAPRLMLHAHTLGLLHPRSGEAMTFVAPLPF
jgi:tRNA pseudouridine32 synthase/23S rRNA pseudouridine746 synthase